MATASVSALEARLAGGPILADGAMGSLLFSLTGRLSEQNHVYEALTLENPDLVRGIHQAYLANGATALTTNTFGANTPSLARFGLAERTDELNRAAVLLAREAIASAATDAQPQPLVLGSIGPINQADDEIDVEGAYGTQVRALIAGGVDAFLLETFPSPTALADLTNFIRVQEGAAPIIAHLAIRHDQGGSGWNYDPVAFVAQLAAAGAAVVGVNCCAPWEALAFIQAVQDSRKGSSAAVPLSAMPNAGGFERIGQRFMSQVNPEYMGRLARQLAQLGAAVVGGCCEVHPPHVREMHAYLRSKASATAPVVAAASQEIAGDADKVGNGPLTRKIKSGVFAVSVEMLPPRGVGAATLQRKVNFVRELAESGLADALDITDGSRGIPLMPPGDLIAVIRQQLGWLDAGTDALELIPHFTTRDLNTMGIQSRLIGYHQRRIHNVLVITGDPPKMSPTYPASTPVFDLDSVALIGRVHGQLNAGVDFGGQSLARGATPRTHFTIGTGFEPEAIDRQRQVERLKEKIAAGVDYVMTQPVFRVAALDLLEPVRGEIPVLVGVLVLTSLAHAQRFGQVPGVVVPAQVLARLASFEQAGDQARAGVEMAVEQVQRVVRDGWAGLYLISPASVAAAGDVLRALGRSGLQLAGPAVSTPSPASPTA
jgi:methionine synthase I (cobalamin-dependent)/5,10-methylenetetrahydrofolate reductase